MSRLSIAFALVVQAFWVPIAESATALRGVEEGGVLHELRQSLMGSSISSEVEAQVSDMQRALRPIFRALPRSAGGFLEPSAVRYLVHRHFVDQNGWFVPTAGSRGEVANESLPEVILGHGTLSSILSRRLFARGLNLHEVSILAVAVEAMASQENAERLRAAYRLAGVSFSEDHVSDEELDVIHKVYLVMYVLGSDYNVVSWEQVSQELADIYTPIPLWDKMRKWASELHDEVLASSPDMRFSFAGQLRFFHELQHRYGPWQDQQCAGVKAALLEHATPGTGRVPFSAYKATSLPFGWTTDDTEEDLSQVGALDYTDPLRPSLIIPNYLDSSENCDDPSKFYSVCCISGCEKLLAHLERELGSPNAVPSRIVEIVMNLPSDTVEAPRTLSAQLLQRLDSIAATHGGHAPLHGRLFRQWMHHAYPAECSFPHVTNDQKLAVLPSEVASNEADSTGTDTDPAQAEELPWLEHEELYLQSPARPQEVSKPQQNLWRSLIMMVIACCMAWRLAHMLAPIALMWRRYVARPIAKVESEPEVV